MKEKDALIYRDRMPSEGKRKKNVRKISVYLFSMNNTGLNLVESEVWRLINMSDLSVSQVVGGMSQSLPVNRMNG